MLEVLGRLPLYVVAAIPELDLNRRDLPPGVRYVGPLLWHPPEPPGTQKWLEALPAGRPWVHVTEGTVHYGDPFLLRAAATGLAGAPYEAILTTGRRRDASAILHAASNIHVLDWLAHDTLLPRCSALVTTGGAGTPWPGCGRASRSSWSRRAGTIRTSRCGWSKPGLPFGCRRSAAPPRRCGRRSTRCSQSSLPREGP